MRAKANTCFQNRCKISIYFSITQTFALNFVKKIAFYHEKRLFLHFFTKKFGSFRNLLYLCSRFYENDL